MDNEIQVTNDTLMRQIRELGAEIATKDLIIRALREQIGRLQEANGDLSRELSRDRGPENGERGA